MENASAVPAIVSGAFTDSDETLVMQLGERLRQVNRELHQLHLQRRWLLTRLDHLEAQLERRERAARQELEHA